MTTLRCGAARHRANDQLAKICLAWLAAVVAALTAAVLLSSVDASPPANGRSVSPAPTAQPEAR